MTEISLIVRYGDIRDLNDHLEGGWKVKMVKRMNDNCMLVILYTEEEI